MSKTTDIQIKEISCSFKPVPFRTPIKFGGRVMEGMDLIDVEVTVGTKDGHHATGVGSMPLGNVWAWPSSKVSSDDAASAMRKFTEEVVHLCNAYQEYGHPLDIVYQISAEYEHLGRLVSSQMGLAEPISPLGQLVSASPIDAALHDAYGRVHNENSFNVLGEKFVSHDLSNYLDDQFKGEYLDQYTLRKPVEKMPLYHLVGGLDPLTSSDVKKPVDDGLPETLGEWIKADGLTHMKIKLNGEDLDWDVARVVAIDKVATEAQAERGCTEWFYSLDFNEKCENVEYVLAFINKIKEQAPAAFDRTQYIEQPTHRDLASHSDQKMHEAAKLKPVVIDESLVEYESLLLAREMGYSGVALKACKGQTESLFLAAAAQKFDLFLCVQDLTCPGYSFLHSASLAAHIPTVAAIEGNGRQYCPAPNKPWARQFPGMFDITDGTVETGLLNGPGLGF